MPAALHDCSINLSYTSDTSSGVQSETRSIHRLVAQTYRLPGSVGADLSSLSEMLYFVFAPAETERIPLGAVPALAVPQYWQRAAGLLDILIAHAESRQRVKLACEHAEYAKFGVKTKHTAKNASLLYISLLDKDYTKKHLLVQREKQG